VMQVIAADARAEAALKEAEAMVTLANAVARKGAAEADARRKMVEAENAVAMKFVLRDVAYRALERMPEVARELMAPAKAIKEIKVLQTGSFGSAGGGAPDGARPALGAMSPILKAILEAGAAYPLLREIMSFAQMDGDRLSASAQSALGELTAELRAVLKKEELAPTSNGGRIDVDLVESRRPGGPAGE
jgi:flotillin